MKKHKNVCFKTGIPARIRSVRPAQCGGRSTRSSRHGTANRRFAEKKFQEECHRTNIQIQSADKCTLFVTIVFEGPQCSSTDNFRAS